MFVDELLVWVIHWSCLQTWSDCKSAGYADRISRGGIGSCCDPIGFVVPITLYPLPSDSDAFRNHSNVPISTNSIWCEIPDLMFVGPMLGRLGYSPPLSVRDYFRLLKKPNKAIFLGGIFCRSLVVGAPFGRFSPKRVHRCSLSGRS